MIALVDDQRKGFITEKEFISYFTDKNYFDEEQIPPLSEEMQRKKKWVEAIDENFDHLKHYEDVEYCQYVTEKMKEEMKSRRRE
jgi:hypothetical protein